MRNYFRRLVPLPKDRPSRFTEVVTGALKNIAEFVVRLQVGRQRLWFGFGGLGEGECDGNFLKGGGEFFERLGVPALLEMLGVGAAIGDQFGDVVFGVEEVDHGRGVVLGLGAGYFERFAIDKILHGGEGLFSMGGHRFCSIVVGMFLRVVAIDAQVFEP